MFEEVNVKKVAIGAAGAVLLLVGIWAWWSRTPQIGGDKESVKVVDALYTAVTSRSSTRLAQCEERLHTLTDEGKFPRPAAKYLDGLIATARAGDWKAATHKLFNFIRAQRPAA